MMVKCRNRFCLNIRSVTGDVTVLIARHSVRGGQRNRFPAELCEGITSFLCLPPPFQKLPETGAPRIPRFPGIPRNGKAGIFPRFPRPLYGAGALPVGSGELVVNKAR